MNYRLSLVLYALIALSACNMQRAETKGVLEGMLESRILLPCEIVCVFSGEEMDVSESFWKRSKLLVYVDSVNCGECQISKFYRFDRIREEGKGTGGYDVVLLLSPKKSEMDALIEKSKLLCVPYPVYFDVNNEFLSMNKVVPDDAQYHTMYLGKDGRVKMVGDPTAGERIKQIFDEVKGQ